MTSKILQLLGNFGGVKTVNGNSPDAFGNVEVEIPEGVSDEHINSLIDTKLGVIENGTY